jgi:hypothetical protein
MRSLCRVYVRVLWSRGATNVIAGFTNVANSPAIRLVAVGVGTLVAYKPVGGFGSVLAAVVIRLVKGMSLAGDTVLRVSAPGSVPARSYRRARWFLECVRPLVVVFLVLLQSSWRCMGGCSVFSSAS